MSERKRCWFEKWQIAGILLSCVFLCTASIFHIIFFEFRELQVPIVCCSPPLPFLPSHARKYKTTCESTKILSTDGVSVGERCDFCKGLCKKESSREIITPCVTNLRLTVSVALWFSSLGIHSGFNSRTFFRQLAKFQHDFQRSFRPFRLVS